MNRQELKNILQSAYDRDLWISTLQFLTGKRDNLTVQLSPLEIEIYTVESQRLIKAFFQIGSVKTSDGVSLPIFEISLADGVQIEQNRVGVNEFIKKYIIKDAIRGALVTFSYDNNPEKTEWRFSFISKNSASDFFAEAEAQETNPKKYTYIFGNEEEHRTAIERLYNLEQSRFRLEDFFEAFNVEPVSKKFFEEYKMLYREFSDFIISKPDYYRLFFNPKDENIKPEKEVRNFVGRLLGRIVFLYFLQKKNWLGASDENYKDGSTTFLSDLFLSDIENQNEFYQKYLCPIFFNALNNPDRENNKFELENGETVCIPFLNGGLFEEEQEPKNHRTIQFPGHRFKMLFDFFNGFNFTVYENSPEEHIVAVDPEMLGHIFENLIDYNKDTGTFYTPKEIVQYMTQESLIEYLNSHLEKEREEIENLIKNQTSADFEDADLVKINEHLDAVKICDPAIGSGAFPMGMLQEIFNLKALISYQLKTDFDPAETKQNIIQNSIYGVDLDEGAVEIARLRFWLSLVVDEGIPKALPNLDYKIMQGNSLLESFRGIDLSNLENVQESGITEQSVIDYGEDYSAQITLFDSISFETLKQLVKEYFRASTSGSRSKILIKKQINDFIESKIHSKIFWEKDKYKVSIDQFYKKYNLSSNSDFQGFNLKSKELKDLLSNKDKYEKLKKIESELISFQNRKERPYFLWHLFFADVLDNGGFDIVIGNPPYIEFKNLEKDIKNEIENTEVQYYKTAKGKYDIYITFYELASRLSKNNGIICYISPTRFLNRDYGKELRRFIYNELQFVEIIDFGDKQNFESAMTYTGIFLLKNVNCTNYNFVVKNSIEDITKRTYNNDLLENESWFFNDKKTDVILSKIKENTNSLKSFLEGIYQGIATGKDEVFVLKEEEVISKDLEKKYLTKFLKGKDISPYKIDWKNTYCIYPYDDLGKVINEDTLKNDSPKLYKYLTDSRKLLEGRAYFDKSNKLWFELWNQRNKKRFSTIKIMTLDNASRNSFAYDDTGFLGTTTTYSLILKNEKLTKILVTFLNSKVLDYYHKNNTIPQAGGFYRYQASFIEDLPIKYDFADYTFLIVFENIIEYTKDKKIGKISDIIENSHLSLFFEEIIDAVVFEVYFPEEMEDKNLQVIAPIEEILNKFVISENFNELSEELKIKLISDMYFAFKESEVQQKMRKFVTSSSDVLKVILQS